MFSSRKRLGLSLVLWLARVLLRGCLIAEDADALKKLSTSLSCLSDDELRDRASVEEVERG